MSSTIDNKSQQTLIIQSLLSRINNNSTNTGTRVTEWSDTPLDTNYPSEKLVKDTIDNLDLTGGVDIIKIYNESEEGKTFYVDYTNGADTNDGLTTSTAFKTVGKAWGEIPLLFTKTYTIKIIGNYGTSVDLDKKIGVTSNSSIIITSNNTSSLSKFTSKFTINGFNTSNSTDGLVISYLKFSDTGLYLRNIDYVSVKNMTFDESYGVSYGIYFRNSKGYVENCSFSGATNNNYGLVYGYMFSDIRSKNNTYSTNKYGAYVSLNSNITSIKDTYTNVITKVSKDNSSTYILVE